MAKTKKFISLCYAGAEKPANSKKIAIAVMPYFFVLIMFSSSTATR
ncbi:hypothetical protein [Pygmaiobacter massiliensis]|nr:hypothetical protein [Pygmaiobacter massiliensis]